MAGPTLAKKKERNVLLDLMKLLFCVLAILAHYASGINEPFFGLTAWASTMPGSPHDGQYIFRTFNKLLGIGGVSSIAIFTFLTGYWMIDKFKKDQKKNLFGRGKNLEVVGKYFFKNYSSYWPFVFFGTLYAIILTYLFVPQLSIFSKFFVNNVIMSIPNLLGLKHLGYALSSPCSITGIWNEPANLLTLTENFTNMDTLVIFDWNVPLWYMFAILVYLPVWYIIFMKDEKIGLFVWTPLNYMVANITLSYPGGRGIWTTIGIDDSWIRLGGPIALGVACWYIVDWIKNTEFSKSGQRIYNIFSIASFVLFLYVIWQGVGGFYVFDLVTAIFACFVLAGKDTLTVNMNRVLLKVPGKNLWGMMSVGIYLLHFPIIDCLNFAFKQNAYPALINFILNLGPTAAVLGFIAFMFILMIPYYFVDKYFIQNLSKLVAKVTKCNEPVVIDTPATAKTGE